jgi:uncharacterized RDD family membrane protein YckC
MTEHTLSHPEKDPRTMITPFAFAVAPDLVGLPLASPARRAFAIGIDFLLVALLSRLNSTIFLIVFALLIFKLWQQADEMAGQRWKNIVRWTLAGVFVIGAGAQVIQQWKSDSAEQSSETISASENEAISDAEKVAQLQKQLDQLKDGSATLGLVNGAQTVLKDIGFDFEWAAIYFTLLTAVLKGQTLGKLALGLRVVQLNGAKLSLWQSFNRYGGYAAGAATGMLGFAQILWDANRQAIHDKISNTVVVDLRRPRYSLSDLPTSPAQ